jgi:hypothetical protein
LFQLYVAVSFILNFKWSSILDNIWQHWVKTSSLYQCYAINLGLAENYWYFKWMCQYNYRSVWTDWSIYILICHKHSCPPSYTCKATFTMKTSSLSGAGDILVVFYYVTNTVVPPLIRPPLTMKTWSFLGGDNLVVFYISQTQ